jgi:hypothetical protein
VSPVNLAEIRFGIEKCGTPHFGTNTGT